MVKCLPTMQETRVQPLGWEDPLEKGKDTYSSILAQRVPWIVYSSQGCKELDTTERLSLSEEEEQSKMYEKIFEEIVVENFPKMRNEIVNQA